MEIRYSSLVIHLVFTKSSACGTFPGEQGVSEEFGSKMNYTTQITIAIIAIIITGESPGG